MGSLIWSRETYYCASTLTFDLATEFMKDIYWNLKQLKYSKVILQGQRSTCVGIAS